MRFRELRDSILGRGEAAVTVPPMDGALRPNDRLERAEVLAEVPVPDNLVVTPTEVLCSSGAQVLVVEADGSTTLTRAYESDVTCLAAMPDGRLVAGLEDGRLVIDGRPDIDTFADQPTVGVTAVVALDERTVIVAQGSSRHPTQRWQDDLLEGRRSGSIWRLDTESGVATRLASGLGYPAGLVLSEDRASVIVSESWRHRLVRLDLARPSEPEPVLSHLPGYPGRLSRAADGGIWMAVFAPRSQLIEFVLREPAYTRRMMRDVPREYWVAPALRSGASFREPLQGGAIKSMGILKPWAPTRSYGLVVRLDPDLAPERSYHSRADGRWHGVTSVVDHGPRLLVTSKGGGAILGLRPDTSEVAA